MDGGGGGLSQADVVLCDVVGRLVLGDLHAGAHVALPVEEEGEGAGQVLAGRQTERPALHIWMLHLFISSEMVSADHDFQEEILIDMDK